MLLGSGEVLGVREKWSDIKLVAEVKQILTERVSGLKDKQFSMYKADVSLDEAEEIEASDVRDRFQQLHWRDSLAELWPNGFDDRLHLVIEFIQDVKPPSHRQPSYGIGELVKIQKSTIEYLNTKNTPSQAAKPSNLLSIQGGKHPIHNGRPYALNGRPIALFNQLFDEFKVAAARPPTTEYLNDTGAEIFKFINGSRDIYQHENLRLEALAPHMEPLLGFCLPQEVTSCCIGDSVVTRSQGGYLLVSEWKDEVGTGGCDPSVQAGFSYARYWGQESVCVSDPLVEA
ncbi:hypothetical protein FRC10_007134 [Ceratobasidium sp. 414]|nr:hypothetical protein FRC10_007134 [Ceratobasidium sp. 414]